MNSLFHARNQEVVERDLRAQGEFSINRRDFKVNATSAMHGMIRVRDKIKFEFEIVGHKR